MRHVVASTILRDQQNTNSNRSLELALAAAQVAMDNRAEEVRVLDMRRQTPHFDYFVICTGFSRRQLHLLKG